MRRALPSGLVGLAIAVLGVSCTHEPDVVAWVGALQDGGPQEQPGAAGTAAPAPDSPSCQAIYYFGYLYPIVTDNCQIDPGIVSWLHDFFAVHAPPDPVGEERPPATNGCDTQFPPPLVLPDANGDWFLCPRFCDYATELVQAENERVAACLRAQPSP